MYWMDRDRMAYKYMYRAVIILEWMCVCVCISYINIFHCRSDARREKGTRFLSLGFFFFIEYYILFCVFLMDSTVVNHRQGVHQSMGPGHSCQRVSKQQQQQQQRTNTDFSHLRNPLVHANRHNVGRVFSQLSSRSGRGRGRKPRERNFQ